MIELNDFSRLWEEKRSDILAAVERVGRSGNLVLGAEVKAFELAFAGALQIRHVVGVGNGLDALEIALRTLGLEPGAKVLTTPLTAFATTLAIVRAGYVPVFVDVTPSGLMDLDQATRLLESDSSVRAILPVHLYGHVLDLDRLAHLRSRFEVVVVEDCAQATGSKWRGRPVGSAGDASCWSFYPTKNLGALGDGGAVAFHRESDAERAASLRNYGQIKKDVHTEIGLNSRLDELHASILNRAFLPGLPEWLARRKSTAQAYFAGLRSTALVPLPVPQGSESSWHLFPVQINPAHRDSFLRYAEEKGFRLGVHYRHLTSSQTALRLVEMPVPPKLENALKLCDSVVSLPIHPYLRKDEIESVIEMCRGWTP